MPYVKFKKDNLVSMRDAAIKLGIDPTTFWNMVRGKKVLPEPTTRRGGRFYYDANEYKALVVAVNALKSKARGN